MPHNTSEQPSILLLEDSGTIRRFVKRLLENGIPGSQVTACEDGQAGLVALRQQHYCVMVTDLQMPRLDGWGLLDAARQEGLLRNTAVLVFSSVVDLARELSTEGLHSMAVLRKPAPSDELLRAVRQQISMEAHSRKMLAGVF